MNCVYRIECLDKNITEIYIGSTGDLYHRTAEHKSNCHNINSSHYNLKIYKFIRENGGWDNWQIVVEYETPNYSKDDRVIEEQLNKDLLKPELNSINAVGLDIERHKSNKKIYMKSHNAIKENCPICGLEMLKKCIKRHIKRKH